MQDAFIRDARRIRAGGLTDGARILAPLAFGMGQGTANIIERV